MILETLIYSMCIYTYIYICVSHILSNSGWLYEEEVYELQSV